MTEKPTLQQFTALELEYCAAIREKNKSLNTFLSKTMLTDTCDPEIWLAYLTSIKDLLGNLNNDISFVATLLAKQYLFRRFSIRFDAALKPQGAPGIDIVVTTAAGLAIVGEIKTTRPYQPGFGAAQKKEINKDLERLNNAHAHHRLMFVTNDDTFKTLCNGSYPTKYPVVEIVHLLTHESSLQKRIT